MEWITPRPPCSPSRSPLSSEVLQCCFTFASVSWESRSLQWDGILKPGRRDRRVHPLHDQPGPRAARTRGCASRQPSPRKSSSISAEHGPTDEIRVGLAGRHPALEYDAARARDCEPVACERGLRGVAGQLAVRAVVADESLKV